MIIGIKSTSDAVFIAETSGERDDFEIKKITRVQFELSGVLDLADLLKTLRTLFAGLCDKDCKTAAVLCCSSGKYGSSLEAIKAEAVAELAAHECGFAILGIKPQGLKAALDCESDETWQAKAKELFNSDGAHKYWSQGADGAVAAAFKAAH